MNFQGKYRRAELPDEFNSGERLTESAGYVPAKVRIEQMIDAGRRLVDYRRGENYDFPEGDPPEGFVPDPTRDPGFDMADASRIARDAGKRIKERRNAEKDKNKEPAKPDVKPAEKGSDPAPGVEPEAK